ncbi:hypothetical protein ACHWQZ_G013476 [Mnemiopsis leidyi]
MWDYYLLAVREMNKKFNVCFRIYIKLLGEMVELYFRLLMGNGNGVLQSSSTTGTQETLKFYQNDG